ncbi:hypothetical protein N431DRAFT_506938 [Stipitochalara longipes BDJ]|nr:hypothetical protein N431DRAFT_506938 [Stipitochalara longipes BDJ]
MVNITLSTDGVAGMTSATYGPVAAAIVLSTPIILIFSVGGIFVHHKFYGKKQINEIIDQPSVTQDPVPTKKKTHRDRRHLKQIAAMAEAEKGLEKAADKIEEENVGKTEELEDKEEAKEKSRPRKAKKTSKQATKQAVTLKPEEIKKPNAQSPAFEYTKGLPRSKTTVRGWQQKAEAEKSEEVRLEQFLEEAYQAEWKVVSKEKKRAKESEKEKEMVVVEEKNSSAGASDTTEEEKTSMGVSHVMEEEICQGLREMEREGEVSIEERVWFAPDEDFTRLLVN